MLKRVVPVIILTLTVIACGPGAQASLPTPTVEPTAEVQPTAPAQATPAITIIPTNTPVPPTPVPTLQNPESVASEHVQIGKIRWRVISAEYRDDIYTREGYVPDKVLLLVFEVENTGNRTAFFTQPPLVNSKHEEVRGLSTMTYEVPNGYPEPILHEDLQPKTAYRFSAAYEIKDSDEGELSLKVNDLEVVKEKTFHELPFVVK